MCPTLSSQWSICAHPQAVAVLQVPQCAPASEAHGQWCTVRDMMHEVRAEPLDHRTRSAGPGRQVLILVRLARGHHTHRSSKCVALVMAVVPLPHPDRTFPGRGIR